jgi:hypothetical protein
MTNMYDAFSFIAKVFIREVGIPYYCITAAVKALIHTITSPFNRNKLTKTCKNEHMFLIRRKSLKCFQKT